MAITIIKFIEEINEEKVPVVAKHRDNLLQAYLCGNPNLYINYLNKEITFEMEYDEIINWNIIEDFSDEDSGLFDKDGNTIIRGTVHNCMDNDWDIIIDIYIMNGADFITILSSEINNYIPQGGEGIEIEIKGLCIYPVLYG